MARRKSDKYKLAEGRCRGKGKTYEPWIRVHEFGSSGRATRLKGYKTKNIPHLLSDLEHYYYLIAHWGCNTEDIRTQYALLPLEQTVIIAYDLGIRHPSEKKRKGEEYVLTTDFLITIVDKDGHQKEIARTIKPSRNISKRVREKFSIEEEYWKRKGVDWGIVTEEEIPLTLGKNLKYLYCNYFWFENMGLTEAQLDLLIKELKELCYKHNFILNKVVEVLDHKNNWKKGESWNLIEYLLLTKKIKTDLITKKFSYYNLKIEFVEG